MIPKTGKPTAKEHRPIALANVGSKIFMGLIKSKLLEHLVRSGLISDLSGRFYRGGGRRLEASMKFPFFHQMYMFDIFQLQMFDQSPRHDYLNSSTFP